MKTGFRIFALSLALVAAFYTPASASGVTCYYSCFLSGPYTTSTTYEECCGGTGSFPCPGGSQGIPYGYDAGQGGQFCMES